MNKYSIKNCQVGAIGEHAKVTNSTFSMNHFEKNEIDIERVKNELLLIKEFLEKKEHKSSDEYILLDHIVQVNDIAIEGKESIIIDMLKKKATKLFYNIAQGVGAGIIANIISKAIGI